MANFPALRTPDPPANGIMRVAPPGGLGEVGRSMTVFELGGKLLTVDCDVLFPEENRPGVDLVLPDFSSIEHRIDDIVALILTHGHENRIGGVPYLLRLRDDIPLVGSEPTLAFAEAKLKEHRIHLALRQVIEREEVFHDPLGLEFVVVNHFIPDTTTVMIRTNAGNVLATGDFRMGSLPIDRHVMDLCSFAHLGEEGMDLFCMDSTNTEVSGMVGHGDEIGQVLDNVFTNSDGQIVVAFLVNHVHHAQQILDAVVLYDRWVVLVGCSMMRSMGIAAECGYLKVPAGALIDARDIISLSPRKGVLTTTGSQGESMAALSRVVHSEHRSIAIEPGDTAIFASSLIPGSEDSAFRVINQLMGLGARVVHQGSAKVHVSEYTPSEELLRIYNVVQPRSVMPIHGEIRHPVANGELAVKTGIAPERVTLCEDGVAAGLEGGVVRIADRVPCGYIYVDGSSVGEIGKVKLKDRRILVEEDSVSVYAVAETTTGMILTGPHIQARGVAEDDSVLEEISPDVTEALSTMLKAEKTDAYFLQQVMRCTLGRWIGRRLGHRPMIVPVVIKAQEEGAHCMTLFRPACFISTESILIDILLHISGVPTPGGAITGASSGPIVGGGYIVVSAAARQGVLMALAATLGIGPNSARVRKSMRLDRMELLVEGLVRDIGTCTMPIESSSRRIFIATVGVEGEPQCESLESIDLRAGDWVYATGYDLTHYTSRGILADWLLSIPDGVGLAIGLGPVQLDIPDQALLPLLRGATMLTGNGPGMGHLEKRLGSTGAIRQACPEALIIRRTSVNGYVLHPVGDEPTEAPGFVREVVDMTGARDTHIGALVAGFLSGLDTVEAARQVNTAVAHAVARSGPAQTPLCEKIDEFPRADDEKS